MSKGLYIGATRPFAGKNMLTIGLGVRLQKEGLNLGYMKPVGHMPTEKSGAATDEDALFIQEVLGLDQPAELVTPVLVSQDFRMRTFSGQENDQFPSIVSAYNKLAGERDLLLVSGSSSMFSGKYCGLDGIRTVRELGLKCLIVDRLSPQVNQDFILTLKESLGESVLGVILNDVPPSFMTEVDRVIQPFLERKGIPVLGIIPHDPLMGSIRAYELAELLGGRLVAAQGRAEGMVENFLIGTMQVENFMTHFRRNPHSAVIVGGDRADVQLVAIEGNCPCLVLTGNLFPNDIILSRADALGIPIVMVREDTYTVARKMESLISHHKMRDVIKVRQGSQLVSNNVNFAAIRKGLGV